MASGVARSVKRNVVSQLLIASTILTSGAIINVVQVLLHILVKPFNKRLFHQLMYYVSWTWLARKFTFPYLSFRVHFVTVFPYRSTGLHRLLINDMF